MIQEAQDIKEHKEVFGFTTINDVVNQTLKHSEYLDPAPSNFKGIPSGFKNLDTITSGFRNGEFTTIAVRPSMGKTAFLLSLTFNIAINNKKSAAVFSSERSAEQMVKRLIESETRTSFAKLINGDLKESEVEHIHSLINNIANANIIFDDSCALTTDDLTKRCKYLKEHQNIEVILIDYLELFRANEAKSTEEEINKVILCIKNLSKELNIPIIVFSKIATALPPYEEYAEPTNEDVHKGITEHSDTIMFIHRPNCYQIKNQERPKGYTELIITKHSDFKEIKKAPLKLIGSIDKFIDFE